jgi:hypothetical protein
MYWIFSTNLDQYEDQIKESYYSIEYIYHLRSHTDNFSPFFYIKEKKVWA